MQIRSKVCCKSHMVTGVLCCLHKVYHSPQERPSWQNHQGRMVEVTYEGLQLPFGSHSLAPP